MQAIKRLVPLLLSLLGLAQLPLTANADSGLNPFQGFYGQIATGYESNSFSNTTTRYTNVSPAEIYSTGTNVAANQTANGMPLILGLGYNFALNEKWILGIGADYSFLSQTTSPFSARNPAFASSVPALGQKIQASDRFNVFLTAGYALTQNDLLYAKAGYSNQQLQFSRPAQDSATGYSLNANQSGYVLGLGYRKTIQGGLYGYAEVNYMQYSSVSMNGAVTTQSGTDTVTTNINQKPSANAVTALIGLGYRF
jgi:outer membrane protein W